ncbi:MAG: glycosyltransferase family 4 protein [Candidatus Buchananbacteria bacterium]|nr:glycosyltransferase family 4 protein [Candidatus Buchananbacteria bacterium]
MKIGVDVRCLMEKQYSGISEYTYNLLKALFKIDQENQYFLFYNSSKPVKMPEFDSPRVFYKAFNYPNKLFNLSLRFLKIAEIDKLVGGVDVFLIPSFLFSNLSKDCRKILIVHDLSFELYPEFFTFKKQLWHHLIEPRRITNTADSIIAISENTKQDVVKIYQTPPEKIDVIYNGISDMFFEPITDNDISRVKKKYDLPDEYIFSLGNLEPRKNVESLLKAFNLLENKSIQLVIAGGQAWKYQKIYQIWQKSAKKNQIKFIGYVDAKDRAALYHLAKVFVYPSIYEGFGLPPIEAMACGTPVISSFTSSLVESVNDAGLLIDPQNYNELAKTIDQYLADSRLQEILKTKGLEYAKQFNWANTAKAVLAVLNREKK